MLLLIVLGFSTEIILWKVKYAWSGGKSWSTHALQAVSCLWLMLAQRFGFSSS